MPLCSHCRYSISGVSPGLHTGGSVHPRDRLAGLMEEIGAVASHIERLRAERDAIQAELDEIVYPVLTLPPEVTSEIFYWCLPSTPVFLQPDPAAPPLVLVAICRRWRNIALATPQLWSYLKIRLGPSITRNENLCLLLERWLSRSASHPLCLLLDDTESEDSTPTSLHDTVVQHAHRLQHLKLVLEHEHLVRYLDNFHGGYPLLQNLSFFASEVGSCALSLASLQTSPQLRTLITETLHLFPHDLPMWSQLTRFEAHNVTPQQDWVILTRLSSLKECILRVAGFPQTNPPTPQAPTTLLVLWSLRVYRDRKSSNPEDVVSFLRFLTLPALTELIFSTDDDHISHFLDFMARSSCSLTRLSIDCSLSTTNFTLLFAAIPRLFQLTIDIPVDYLGDLSSILAARNGHLPNLRELIIGFPVSPNGDSPLHYPLLIDMLQSRSEGDPSAGMTRLELFKLLGSESHLAFLAPFHALEQKGMHIIFEPCVG